MKFIKTNRLLPKVLLGGFLAAALLTIMPVMPGRAAASPTIISAGQTAITQFAVDPPTTNATCETSGNILTWILCPVFNMMAGASDYMFNNIVQPFLITPPLSTNSSDPSYQIWSAFRIYGNIFLVIALLVVVFGQSIGGGLVDAYTAKKILPRLLAAAILINLSIYLVAILVDIFNILGRGIGDIMTAPLQHCSNGTVKGHTCWAFEVSLGQSLGAFSVGIVGLLLSGASIVGFFGALFFGGITAATAALSMAFFVMLPVLLAILGVFVTLVIRKGLILFLVLISPIAFALYCLPNTEKYFKKWWELLITALAIYPIIVVIFAVADILSITILTANKVTPDGLTGVGNAAALQGDQILAAIIAFLLQFLPLLAIPFSFKFAGGVLGRLNGVLTGAGGKLNAMTKARTEQARSDYNAQSLTARGRSYHRLNDGMGARKGLTGKTGRFLASRVGGYNIEAALSGSRAQVAKQVNDQIATGRDEEVRGLTVNKKWARAQKGWRDEMDQSTGKMFRTNGQVRENLDAAGNVTSTQFKSLGGAWVSEQDVDQGHARWGRNAFAQQAALSYEMRKATTEDQIDNLSTNYNNVAEGWGYSRDKTTGDLKDDGGAWIGAAFENQNQHLQFKHTDINGRMSAAQSKKFVSEIYEKKGSYPLAQMSSKTIEQLKEAHTMAASTGDVDTMNHVKAISETFMSEMGTSGVVGTTGTGPSAVPLTSSTGGAGRRQANTPGAAHVAERVRELAVQTGAYAAAPTGPHVSPSDYGTSAPNQMEQK